MKFKFQTSVIFSCLIAHASFTVFIKGWVTSYCNLRKFAEVKMEIVWLRVFISLVVWILLFHLTTHFFSCQVSWIGFKKCYFFFFFTTYRDPRSFRSPSSFSQIIWNRILGTLLQHRVLVCTMFYPLQHCLSRINTGIQDFVPVLTN